MATTLEFESLQVGNTSIGTAPEGAITQIEPEHTHPNWVNTLVSIAAVLIFLIAIVSAFSAIELLFMCSAQFSPTFCH